MADKKKDDTTPTNYQGQPASQETSVRDAKGDEKPDESSVAQAEDVKE